MSSCLYRKSHCGDKTVVKSFYLHNGISYILNQSAARIGTQPTTQTSRWTAGTFALIQYKMSSYQYRKSHYADKMVIRLSYLHNGFSCILNHMTARIGTQPTAGVTEQTQNVGQTDGQTEWNQYTPQQLCCAEGIVKIHLKFLSFLSRTFIWKCHVQNVGHFDLAIVGFNVLRTGNHD